MISYQYQCSTRGRLGKKELPKISLGELEPCTVSDQKIEHMKYMVCTHRTALDFDISFFSADTTVEFDENSEKKTSQKGGKVHLFKKILPSNNYT